MTTELNKSRISLIQGDITRERLDAIVNAANSSLMGGGGVDGAIHRAGGPSIKEECKQIVALEGRLPPGKAAITGGGNLPVTYVIHTVGPIWRGGSGNEDTVLASAYRESLRLAHQYEVQTIAFPSISTGAYGFPVQRAAEIAISTVIEFLDRETRPEEKKLSLIKFVLFDPRTLESYKQALESR